MTNMFSCYFGSPPPHPVSREAIQQRANSLVNIKSAIENQDESAVRAMLANVPRQNINQLVLELLTHAYACSSSQPVKRALTECADFDMNARGNYLETALDLAAKNNDIPFAKHLVSKGAIPGLPSARHRYSEEMCMLLDFTERKNKLYPPNLGVPAQNTGLDGALRSGKIDMAKAQLVAEKGDQTIKELWQSAVQRKRFDILRGILLLSDAKALGALDLKDAALSDVIKRYPYQSAKHGTPRGWNCRARFDNDEVIACRHLATYQQEEQALHPKLKFQYDKFKDIQTIAANVKRMAEIDARYKALTMQASETHLVNNAKFGRFLAGQFAAMEREGKATKLMLVEATHHTMNLGLRIKNKDGKKFYVVKFFDPNRTTTGMRCKTDNLKTLEAQTIASYMDGTRRLKAAYPEEKGVSTIFVRPDAKTDQGYPPASQHSGLGRTLTTCIDSKDVDATVVYHFLKWGFSGNLRQLREYMEKLPEDERIALLAAKRSDGLPGLYQALEHARTEAIKAYGELLTLIPEDKRVELLAAKDASGIPALFSGLAFGSPEAIEAYGELLTLIPEDKRTELLAAKDPSGFPALCAALANERAAAMIEAYGKLLALIPEDKRAELLAAKDPSGFSALYTALRDEQTEAIKAYDELLILVPPDKQAEVLLEKNAEGKSGLHMALEMGKFEMVGQQLAMLIRLAPELSPGKRAWLWGELKGNEENISQCQFQLNLLSHRQYSEMRSRFSTLKGALMDDDS